MKGGALLEADVCTPVHSSQRWSSPVPMGGRRISRTRSIHRAEWCSASKRKKPTLATPGGALRLSRSVNRPGSVCTNLRDVPPQAPGVSAPQTASRRAGAGGASCGMGRGSIWEVESPGATVAAAGPGPVPLPQVGSESRCMFRVFHHNKEREKHGCQAQGSLPTCPMGPGLRAKPLGANESERESDHAADVWEPRPEPLPVRPQLGDWRPGHPHVSWIHGNTPALRAAEGGRHTAPHPHTAPALGEKPGSGAQFNPETPRQVACSGGRKDSGKTAGSRGHE